MAKLRSNVQTGQKGPVWEPRYAVQAFRQGRHVRLLFGHDKHEKWNYWKKEVSVVLTQREWGKLVRQAK